MLLLYIVAPEGHVSPETEQVSSPGSASSTHLEEHDEEDFDDDDDDDDDAAAAAIDTQIQASDHEEVPIETVLPPKRPANTTYDAIVASEGKIVEAENRRHSDLMTVLERMIALQEETVSQLAHLHRVFIEVPKQLQKINTSFEALVVQQTQANYWRMTNKQPVKDGDDATEEEWENQKEQEPISEIEKSGDTEEGGEGEGEVNINDYGQ
ncbi:uncharacterized protein LOC142486781 [Ascaphus truei]|uniref:uncharacterized protein LOC142486781 n=1 Tax=Ascaphus truei TaxID=8439 RepID=UPI003F59772F